ncbi:MAG: glucose-1-phosphate thymidylyltransferase [Gammaproteobacteria bacterium]|jgi:glucose-1-phosphate thymidylyltransferase
MNSNSKTRGALMGAILAGGRGTRMWPFSTTYPKPLLPICNKPVIVHQIEMMRDVGITDIVILIGHKGYEITKALGDGRALGVRLRYVEQIEMLGIAHAVGHLEELLDLPFMLFLGDIFFKAPRLTELVNAFVGQDVDAVLAAKHELDAQAIRRNFSVVQTDDGLVGRVIEKPRHPPSSLKGVGLYVFSPTVFDAIRRTPRTAMRNEYELTDAIQVMINDGQRVGVADMVDEDLNLTNPHDLLAVNLSEAKVEAGGSLVDASAHLAAPELVEGSVIGAHARVLHPIKIIDSLIFDGVEVTAQHNLYRAIVTADGILDCSAGPDERT